MLDELRAFGVELLSVDDPDGVQAWLRRPDPEVLERNVELVRPALLARRPARSGSQRQFDATGWSAMVTPRADPVVARRARIARWVALAKRIGYGLLLLAVVAFVVAAIAGFPSGLVTVTVVALIAACVVLPVPIVLGYGLRAAEREDREAQARRAGGEPPAARQ